MTRAPLDIYACRSGQALGEKICAGLSERRKKSNDRLIPLKKVLVRPGIEEFACGEFKATLEESVRGEDVFLIQCAVDRSTKSRSIQDNVWEMLQAVEALRACHAEYITVILPCLPYSRQEKRDGRESCSAVLLAKMIATAGANYMITVDLHASQIKGYYDAVGVRPDALYTTPLFIDYLKETYPLDRLVVQAADEGGGKRARFYAGKLFGNERMDEIEDRISPAIKHRSSSVANRVESIRILGNINSRIPVIPEDIIDTAGTLEALLNQAHNMGAEPAIICATHAIMSGPATGRLDKLYAEGKLKEILTTDTIPQPAGYAESHPWFRQFSVAPMLAEVIHKINREEKTSPLYL